MRDNGAAADGFGASQLAPGMSRSSPALSDFRRIVVKVGSSLLVDRDGRAAARRVAGLAGRGHREAARREARPPGGVLRRDRARPRGAQAAERSAQARRFAGRRRRRPDRAGAHLVGGARPPRHHGRPGAGDAAGHRGAPALSQRPLDHREAAGMARGAGDQRERHRRHQRDPLWRQRPPRRARRHHGERRPAGAALRRRRALRRAARCRAATPSWCR